jgi:hypothetical protein
MGAPGSVLARAAGRGARLEVSCAPHRHWLCGCLADALRRSSYRVTRVTPTVIVALMPSTPPSPRRGWGGAPAAKHRAPASALCGVGGRLCLPATVDDAWPADFGWASRRLAAVQHGLFSPGRGRRLRRRPPCCCGTPLQYRDKVRAVHVFASTQQGPPEVGRHARRGGALVQDVSAGGGGYHQTPPISRVARARRSLRTISVLRHDLAHLSRSRGFPLPFF